MTVSPALERAANSTRTESEVRSLREAKNEAFIRSHIEGLRADGWNEDFLREEERLMRSNMHASAVVDHILSNIGLRI